MFYGWWDWRFLSLILLSTVVDFVIGKKLKTENKQSNRKILLWVSIAVNLGFLGFFKYYNFFLDNFITAFSFFGNDIKANSLNILLPVGISFYTFQTLSYSIDVYKRKLEPTKEFIAFAAFVSFFPQLVAGPIERASNLLPQFHKKRTFDYSKSVDGMRQILWGLFKKIVIADNCAQYANFIFDNSDDLSGSTLILGALFFTFQLYADFSGYSDIAIGTARLFGFNLIQNFAFPIFSRSAPEFWRRWHISLTTWFRDYLFIPLIRAGKVTALAKINKTFILFAAIGFWHGANWTFVAWGILQAILIIPSFFTKSKFKITEIIAKGKHLPSLKEFYYMTKTFSLNIFTLIFFRAENINHAFAYISDIFSTSLFTIPKFEGIRSSLTTIALVVVFMLIEWQGREGQYAIERLGLKWNRYLRYSMYLSIIFVMLLLGGKKQDYIYFQF